jgi:subfamily B ATP-binding cassette protein HlyB/CyaB
VGEVDRKSTWLIRAKEKGEQAVSRTEADLGVARDESARSNVEDRASEISFEQFAWVVGSLCQLHRIPFDARLLAQQYPPSYDAVVLQQAIEAYGFKVGEIVGASDFSRVPLPCIAFVKDSTPTSNNEQEGGSTTPSVTTLSNVSERNADGEIPRLREVGAAQTDASVSESHVTSPGVSPALILKADASRLLYFRALSNEPRTVSLDAFDASFAPKLLLIALDPDSDAGKAASARGKIDPFGDPLRKKEFGFSWFVPELLKHKVIWRDVLLASLAIQLVGLTTPLMTQVVIDKIVVHQTLSTLWIVAGALVMFMVFTTGMTWLRQYLVLHTGNRIDATLGSQVFKHLFQLPLPYFEHRPTGTLVARLQGVENIRNFVSSAAVTLVLDFPFLLIFLAVMFWYSWQLSLVAVFMLGLISLMSLAVTPIFRIKVNQQFLLGARNQAFVTEYVAGMETVKSLQMEPVLEKKYGAFLSQYLAATFSTRTLANSYNVIANAMEQTMTLAILVVGALLVIDATNSAPEGGPTFTIGMLVAFQMFASRMSQPMLRLVGLWQDFQQANISVKRLGDLMNAAAEPYALIPQRLKGNSAGAIQFANVSFRYSEKHPYLYRNLNLEFKPGKLTVLMGPSGCGKSTLAKLLQGFYPPTDGAIKVDGNDIRYMAANELRSMFGVVPQETVLFSGSVFENLQAANPHATFDDIVQACNQAGIHATIEALPQGYQTPLGEHGVGLSGGQRQRIAISRALLKRPKVLIFDEATSNLDQVTAEQFAQTVNALKGKVTMIFIAHAVPKGLQVDEVVQFGGRAASGPMPAAAGAP